MLDKAVQNVVNFVNSNELDGVDLDLECWWDKNSDASKDQGGRPKSEGPHPAGYALTLFAQKLKQAMPDKLVSATLFGTSWYGNNYDSKIADYVDWLAIMTYDLTGSWNESPVGPHSTVFKIRNQDSAKIRNQEFYQESYTQEQQGEWPGKGTTNNPILSVEDTLWYWTNPLFVNWQGSGQNIPRNKIAAGVPIYGYDFAYGKDPDDLSGQIPPGYKTITYKDILNQFPDAHTAANGNIKVSGSTPRPPFVSAAGTYPYAHNIYFETPKTATDKLNFLKSIGAQGVIIWELSNDVWEDGKSIIKALYQNSGNPPKQPKPKDWSPNNWLTSIPDTKKLSELTIPGTHDSCTYTLKNEYPLTPITRTQHLTLEQQLSAGIRYLDIRCRHINNAFAIHHDLVYVHLNFDDVLNVCKAFLTANSSECIVMLVKREYKDGEGVTRSFEDTFNSYVEGSKDFWYLSDTIPTLEDVRGKIVLLRRFTGTKGIDPNPWADNFSTTVPNGTLKVQDHYHVGSLVPLAGQFDVNKKWNAIKDLLDEARDDSSKDNWYINYLSGSSAGAYPNAIAGRINHRVSAYVEDKSLSQVRLGTIVTDFPDDNGKTDMVNRIIAVNFR